MVSVCGWLTRALHLRRDLHLAARSDERRVGRDGGDLEERVAQRKRDPAWSGDLGAPFGGGRDGEGGGTSVSPVSVSDRVTPFVPPRSGRPAGASPTSG